MSDLSEIFEREKDKERIAYCLACHCEHAKNEACGRYKVDSQDQSK